ATTRAALCTGVEMTAMSTAYRNAPADETRKGKLNTLRVYLVRLAQLTIPCRTRAEKSVTGSSVSSILRTPEIVPEFLVLVLAFMLAFMGVSLFAIQWAAVVAVQCFLRRGGPV